MGWGGYGGEKDRKSGLVQERVKGGVCVSGDVVWRVWGLASALCLPPVCWSCFSKSIWNFLRWGNLEPYYILCAAWIDN